MGSVVSNSGVKSESSGPVVFGAFCFYAHNECKSRRFLLESTLIVPTCVDEFGQWRPVCDRFGAEYLDAYHTFVKISAPEEDFDGRVDLYKLQDANFIRLPNYTDTTIGASTRMYQHFSMTILPSVSSTDPLYMTLLTCYRMLGDMRDLVSRYG